MSCSRSNTCFLVKSSTRWLNANEDALLCESVIIFHYIIFGFLDVTEDIDLNWDEGEDELDYSEPTQEELKNLNVYVTTDNATNISKAVDARSFTHFRCFAHTVNPAVKRGLEVAGVKSLVGDVRQIAKPFRKSLRLNTLLRFVLWFCI